MKRTICSLMLTAFLVLLLTTSLSSADRRDRQVPTTSQSAKRSETTQKQEIDEPRNATVSESSKRTTRSKQPETTKPQDSRQIPLPAAESPLQTAPPMSSESGSAGNLRIDWLSVNHGGEIEVASASYRLGVSVAQSVAGEVSTDALKMGLGFWYGAAGGSECYCPHHADPNESGFTDVEDLNFLIDAAFAGGPIPHDPTCPMNRIDVDCNTFVDIIDVNYLVDYLFAGGPPPCDPCAP
jgi:hypothetical protein